MKKSFQTICFVTVALLLGACADEENNADSGGLEIVQSSLSFTAVGGSGKITVESATPVTASTSEQWCRPRVEGSIIHVDVDRHLGQEGRAAQVTITNTSGQKRKVAVVQEGNTFTVFDEIVTLDDSDVTTAVDISCYVDVTARADSAWLKVDIAGK